MVDSLDEGLKRLIPFLKIEGLKLTGEEEKVSLLLLFWCGHCGEEECSCRDSGDEDCGDFSDEGELYGWWDEGGSFGRGGLGLRKGPCFG